MTGIQLSVNWAVAQAADALAASSTITEREAGRSLRCCEVSGLDRAGEFERESGTQGLRVALGFYGKGDLATVAVARDEVAQSIAQAMGLYHRAVQLDLSLLTENGRWLGIRRPYQRGGTGLRLDRYLTAEVLKGLEAKQKSANWRYLAERPGEVRILLRRLRYRLGEDYGSERSSNRYAFWTTDITEAWARKGREHKLEYLVSRLSQFSKDLTDGHAAHAASLDPGYWGEVDTERDPLRVKQITTSNGTTREDVRGVLAHAGAQIRHVETAEVSASEEVNTVDPLAPFVNKLNSLLDRPTELDGVDVLFVHRGGGVNPDTKWRKSNVPTARKRELLTLCREVRDLGIEVVVALGHANVSVFPRWRSGGRLPLGLFEATTPTGGAAWILQEHINPRLVDRNFIFSQPREG